MDSSHGLTAGAGAGFGAALVAIVAHTWNIDPGIAGDWIIVATGILAVPFAVVYAYASVKAKSDPALAAAIAALAGAVPGLAPQPPGSTQETATVTKTVVPPAPAPVIVETALPPSAIVEKAPVT